MEAGSSGKATHQRVSWYHSVARATRIADFPMVYTLIESRLRELWTLDCFAMDDFPTSKLLSYKQRNTSVVTPVSAQTPFGSSAIHYLKSCNLK